MESILKDLYLGNIHCSELPLSSEYCCVEQQIRNLKEELCEPFDDSQKSKLEELTEKTSELCGICEIESFIEGFRLGVKILSAALQETT